MSVVQVAAIPETSMNHPTRGVPARAASVFAFLMALASPALAQPSPDAQLAGTVRDATGA
jgi:hypothetical protein